jgi:methyl-accepting chemotaxis protein
MLRSRSPRTGFRDWRILKTWLVNLSISRKLAFGFGICLLLSMIIGLQAVRGLNATSASLDKVVRESNAAMAALGDVGKDAGLYRVRLYRVAGLKGKEAEVAQVLLDKSRSAIGEDFKRLEKATKGLGDAQEKEAQTLKATWEKGQGIAEGIKDQIRELDPEKAFTLTESSTTKIFRDEFNPQFDKTTEAISKAAKANEVAAFATVTTVKATVFALTFLSMVFGVVISILLTRSVTVPVSQIRERLESLESNCMADLDRGMAALASGDLTVEVRPVTTTVPYTSNDELGQVAKTFNSTLAQVQHSIESYNSARASLSALVGKVMSSAEGVAQTSITLAATSQESSAAASEIADGASQLAANSSAAAERVRQLALGAGAVTTGSESQGRLVEDMSAAISEAASGVESVSESARDMQTAASTGNVAVKETVAAMDRVKLSVERSTEQVRLLDEKGREIGKIVETIEQIAAQTNLLALNAAIEAARAGEHGRGFAVVADEVRKLAEQSTQSTKQIGELIASVTKTVEETVNAIQSAQSEVILGTEKSGTAGAALDQILVAAQTVLDQNQAVATLSREISASMDEVSQTSAQNLTAAETMSGDASSCLQEIDGVAAVSEESAAAVEELSATISEVGAAANELSHMSKELNEIVSSFKIDNAGVPAGKPQLRVAA